MRFNCCTEIFVPYIVFLLNIIFCASLQCALDLKGKYRLPKSLSRIIATTLNLGRQQKIKNYSLTEIAG